MKPAWPGPYSPNGGWTQSILGKILVCPYQAYLWLILGLEEPSELHPNLIWGDTFHFGLEQILKRTYRIKDFDNHDWDDIKDKVYDYLTSEYPQAPDTYFHTITEMLPLYDDSYKDDITVMPEQVFCEQYVTNHSRVVYLRGKVDGISTDGTTLIEHKCKGKIDGEQSRYETPQDLQVNLYSMVTGARKVIYDLIRIPEASFYKPYRKKGLSPEKYVEQLMYGPVSGDFPVIPRKPRWIEQFPVFLDDAMIQEYRQKTIDPCIEWACKWWDHVTQPGFDPNDPKFYNEFFYKVPVRQFDPTRTEKFKCDYWSYLVGQIDLEDLVPVKSFYSELSSPPVKQD